jgi:hypothetical protein
LPHLQIKEALRTYTIDRKLASLAKVVAITFAEDLIGEQLERRLNKFLPRGERYPFQNLVAVRSLAKYICEQACYPHLAHVSGSG